jgi:hypothetical protein
MRPGVSISVTFGSNNDVPNDRWIFIRDKDIESHDIGKNHISRKNNLKMMNGSTVINKTYYDDKRRATYVAGPGREDVQKITGRTIKPVAVHEKDKPGQTLNNGQLQIYRPQVQKNNTGNKPTPSQLANLKDVKQISERNTGKQQQNIQSLNVKTGKKLQTVNLPKKINTKAVLSQSRNKNQPDNSISKALQSATVSKNNSKNNADRPPKAQAMNPPKDDRSTDRPPDAGTMNPARDNRSTDRPPVTQTMNAPKDDRSTDRPPKTDPNDDNRIKREP